MHGVGEYRELDPSTRLRADVLCVWYDDRLRATSERREQLVVPDGCADIVWIRGRAPTVAGPATIPVLAELPPDAPVLGLRFRPGRAPAFLGQSAEALLNADVPLRDLWGDAAERLADALEQAPTLGAGLRTMERAVEQHPSARDRQPGRRGGRQAAADARHASA